MTASQAGKAKNEGGLGMHVVELTGESTPNYGFLSKADILIVTLRNGMIRDGEALVCSESSCWCWMRCTC